jgi:hypothetical protein
MSHGDFSDMKRRDLLRASLPAALLSTSGCLWFNFEGRYGQNPNLRLTNDSDSEAVFHVAVRRDEFDESDTQVFQGDITVPAGQTVERKVLGNDQYWIDVDWRGEELEFPARPICDHARTEVFLTADEELRFEVDGCE